MRTTASYIGPGSLDKPAGLADKITELDQFLRDGLPSSRSKSTPVPGRFAEAIRFVRSLGITTIPAPGAAWLRSGMMLRLWLIGQQLTEEYLSWLSLRQWAHARTNRSWDGFFPSQVGLLYRVAVESRRKELGPHIAIGQACPNCARGRLSLFAHPDDDCLGVYCNTSCPAGNGDYEARTFGVEIGRKPIGQVIDDRVIWAEPVLEAQGVRIDLDWAYSKQTKAVLPVPACRLQRNVRRSP